MVIQTNGIWKSNIENENIDINGIYSKLLEITSESGVFIFLTGDPGAGKTYTSAKLIIERAKGKPLSICAPTHAAIQVLSDTLRDIGGAGQTLSKQTKTIASFLYGSAWLESRKLLREFYKQNNNTTLTRSNMINLARCIIERDKHTIDRLSVPEYLFIDEISMVSASTLDLLDITMRLVKDNNNPFGGTTVIVCGDFFQLTPTGTSKYAFQSSVWKHLTHFIRLNGNKRLSHDTVNRPFHTFLSDIRRGGIPADNVLANVAKLFNENIIEKKNETVIMPTKDEIKQKTVGKHKFKSSLIQCPTHTKRKIISSIVRLVDELSISADIGDYVIMTRTVETGGVLLRPGRVLLVHQMAISS